MLFLHRRRINLSNDTPQTYPPENFGTPGEIPIQARPIDTANVRGMKFYEELVARHLEELLKGQPLLTTRDRAQGCIENYGKRIEQRIERRRQWIIPASFFVAFFGNLTTIHTGTFLTNLMGFSQDELRGAFYVLTGLALSVTVWAVFRGMRSPDISVERVINEMDYRKPRNLN
jgi:hypothetical protein